MRGDATMRAEAAVSVMVAMDDFLCKSDLSLALKSSRGSWRSSAATCNSGSNSGSPVATVTTRVARSWVTAWSSWSISLRLGILCFGRERLGIGSLHAGTQVLQGAELQLFYRALAASQGLRDFTNAFLLGETHSDHAALIGGQLINQAKKPGALIGFFQLRPFIHVGQISKLLSGD